MFKFGAVLFLESGQVGQSNDLQPQVIADPATNSNAHHVATLVLHAVLIMKRSLVRLFSADDC
jgi:hypothetical protein